MGRLVLNTSVAFAHDAAVMIAEMRRACSLATRRYFFVGETHNSPFDKARTVAIAEELASDHFLGPLVVCEREIFGDDPAQAYLQAKPHFVHEPTNLALTSGSHERNVRVVQQLLEATREADRAQNNRQSSRAVVILFGQAHAEPILQELLKQTPDDEEIAWVSYPSLAAQIAALPSATDGALPFRGFCEPPADPAHLLAFALHTKGRHIRPFDIQLLGGNAPDRLRRSMHAVHSATISPAMHREMFFGRRVTWTIGNAETRIVPITDAARYDELKNEVLEFGELPAQAGAAGPAPMRPRRNSI